MLNSKHLAKLIIVLLTAQISFAQLGFSHEIGVIAGPVAFKSDFGLRSEFETNAGNTGFGIGIVHYINFAYQADCNCYTTDNYFNDHFKLRTEISYNKTKLEHFGEFVDPSRTGVGAQQLRGHKGEANNFDIGMQIEYFPLSIRSFQAFSYKLAPFVSFGAHYVSFNPEVSSTFTPPPGTNTFYSPWFVTPDSEPIDVSGGNTWSVVTSIGARYKLTTSSDLMIDLRGQYYFNDLVDGLDHELVYNKNDDWLVWLNFGYIYYLD
ncbi:glutamate dehydrogenase [Lacinutrix sp.]|uniref:THC0290_0291 family protein n=1 Tax=Lacinutrix sp. TaxID=1937692 RepID=UPI0025BF2619|nr:glutamate dehydrogenase [Lacinutrix sp.]